MHVVLSVKSALLECSIKQRQPSFKCHQIMATILLCAQPGDGHVFPLSVIARDLVSRGYEVYFMTGSGYRGKIEGLGVSFVPLTGKANWTMEIFKSINEGIARLALAPGSEQTLYMLEQLSCDTIPTQHLCIQEFLKAAKTPVIIVHEVAFGGVSPVLLGAPGLKPTATIGVGISPLWLSNENVPPFWSGLEYDDSEEGRKRNKLMLETMSEGLYSSLNKKYDRVLESLGASKSPWSFTDAMVLLSDRFLQMCIPTVEYPHTSFPASLRFAGGIPKVRAEQTNDYPRWWSDVTSPSNKVVFVCQGTASRIRFEDLVIPTVEGLAEEDIIVVAALGRRGLVLSPGTTVPRNAHIIDFMPYDDIFPYADVFVTNGGYGGFQHAINHGVPMVIAGVNADKPEVAARAEWAGVGINLKMQSGTKETIKRGVLEILSNKKYRARAHELQTESKAFDCLAVVAETIEEVVASSA